MVCDVVAGIQEFLQQEQAPTKTPGTISEPNEHVENAVKITQHQVAAQLQNMQKMMQDIQLQYSAAPQLTHQDYGGRGYYEG